MSEGIADRHGSSVAVVEYMLWLVRRVAARMAHEIPDGPSLQLRVGEQVQVGDTDTEWPEFVFVTAPAALAGSPAAICPRPAAPRLSRWPTTPPSRRRGSVRSSRPSPRTHRVVGCGAAQEAVGGAGSRRDSRVLTTRGVRWSCLPAAGSAGGTNSAWLRSGPDRVPLRRLSIRCDVRLPAVAATRLALPWQERWVAICRYP